MSLETVERKVRLVHLGVEVLAVVPGLHFGRLDLLSTFVKIWTYDSYILLQGKVLRLKMLRLALSCLVDDYFLILDDFERRTLGRQSFSIHEPFLFSNWSPLTL